jgi:hypothetical protein
VILSAPLNPVGTSTGSGFGSIQISDDLTSAFVQIIFSGLSGDATDASFSGAVSFPLVGVPFDTSGSASGTFSLNSGDAFALESGGGTFSVSSTFASPELAGSLPEGDAIGGGPPPIILPPPSIPEPATGFLVFAGIAGLLWRVRHRATRTRS